MLIVGAGPTGLTAANILAQSGVKVRVAERDAGPIDESRALLVHGRTQEFFDKLGLSEDFLERGQALDGVNVMVGGHSSGHIPIVGDETKTPYPYPVVFEQSRTQRLLLEGLAREGVAVEWGTKFTGFTQDAQGVGATLESGGQTQRVRARYLIGADGASSAVRHAANIPFEGSTYEHAFFLADFDMDWDLGHDKLYLNVTKDYFFAFFPMYGENTYGEKQFRIIGTLTPEQSQWDEISLAQIETIVNENGVEAKLFNARWTSIYLIHKRHAPYFRERRVFLAGDSAHIHSPAGGQGMNTSIGDAVNLAWKLAAAVKGEANDALLASYETERYPVAQYILKMSDRNFDIEATTNPFMKCFRLLIAPVASKLLRTLPAGRNFMFDYLSQIAIGYPESPAVQTADGAQEVGAGERAPYGFLEENGERVSLFEHFRGVGHQLLFFEGKEAKADFAERCDEIERVTSSLRISPQVVRIPTRNTELHAAYRVSEPTVFLIRPDGYIGYRGALEKTNTFAHYVRRFYTDSRYHLVSYTLTEKNIV